MTPSLFNSLVQLRNSLRKQPTFGDATTGFPTKGCQRNERRNSILMTCHYPDLGSASDWPCCMGNLIQPIRGTSQIWVETHHQYEFLHSFPRHHLAGKPVVASPNVNCFLRLFLNCTKELKSDGVRIITPAICRNFPMYQ